MATVELADSYVDLRISPHGIAFLTDAILIQRYLENDGQLRRAMGVVKLRASQHSKDLRQYEITAEAGSSWGRRSRGTRAFSQGLRRRFGRRGEAKTVRSSATSGVCGR